MCYSSLLDLIAKQRNFPGRPTFRLPDEVDFTVKDAPKEAGKEHRQGWRIKKI
jgi:hypothetical protein